MVTIGYCPWCGTEISMLSMFATTHDIEWNKCRTWRCKGNNIEIITDEHGYVRHPQHIRGRYIFVKPNINKELK